MTHRAYNLKYMAKIGILAAVAAVLMYLEMPLPFVPPFYKLDVSEIPILIGGFALGPVAALWMELLKNLLHLILKGTTTAFVGELANFVTGCALVCPAALLYKRHKTFKRAIAGLVAGTLCLVFVGALLNYFVLIPTYATMYHLSLDTIVEMGTEANPWVKDLTGLIVFAVMPFNLLKATICSLVTLAVYKKLSGLLHR